MRVAQLQMPLEPTNVVEKLDACHGMIRTEVRSNHGDSRLGHVFDDGPPQEGGLRYYINSAGLRFVPYEGLKAMDGIGTCLRDPRVQRR
jgi:peptide-methionine (R)-S-oxide reductase